MATSDSENFLRRRISSLVEEVEQLEATGCLKSARSRLEATLKYAELWLGFRDREIPALLNKLGDLLLLDGNVEEAEICYIESWLLEDLENTDLN